MPKIILLYLTWPSIDASIIILKHFAFHTYEEWEGKVVPLQVIGIADVQFCLSAFRVTNDYKYIYHI